MKKLFTLMVMALVALGASAAQKDLGNPTNNAEGWFDEATKKITFVEAGSYKPGWWLAWNNDTQSNSGQDFSAYDKVVVELKDIQNCGTISVYFEYLADGVEQDIATVDATTGKATITLKEAGKNAVKQMYLQATEAGGTCTFVSAYAENDAAPVTSVDIFKGTSTVTLGWNEDSSKGEVNMVKGTLTDDAKSLLKVGNFIGADFTCEPYESNEAERYYQVQFMGGWWTVLDGALGTNGAEKDTNGNVLIPLEATSTNVEFKLTESDVATLKAQGSVKLAGHGIYVSRIYISETSQAPAAETPAGETEVLKLDEGATYTANQVLTTANAQVTLGNDLKKAAYAFQNSALEGDYSSDFIVACKDSEGKDISGVVAIAGGDNPKDGTTSGAGSGIDCSASKTTASLPQNGTYYIFKPSKDGAVKAGIILNKEKEFYVIDATDITEAEGKKRVALPESNITTYTIKDASGAAVALADGTKGGKTVADKVVGFLEFDVKANHSYYFFCTGSKLGFFGYAFTPGGTTGIQQTIAPAKVIENNVIYNLAGQRVNENYKGIVIKNGKKYIQK